MYFEVCMYSEGKYPWSLRNSNAGRIVKICIYNEAKCAWSLRNTYSGISTLCVAMLSTTPTLFDAADPD